jgi:hypothetical protein
VLYECIQYILLDYVRLNMSGSENAVGFVHTGCRCGKTVREGKGVAVGQVVQPDAAWHACHKSVDTGLVTGLLLWNELPVVVVGLDV